MKFSGNADGWNQRFLKNESERSLPPYGEQINGVVQGKAQILTAITHGLANQYIFYFCGIIPLTFFVFFAFVRSNNRKFEQYK